MKFILDTNVISALRVPSRNPNVARWVEKRAIASQFVSALTIAEIERGVAAIERADVRQGEVLRRWFSHRVLPAFHGRVLSFDLAAARVLATYRMPEHAPMDDALIGAIAQANDMTVCTRNIKHFETLGIACVNPWEEENDE